jgi:hypothetical protein
MSGRGILWALGAVVALLAVVSAPASAAPHPHPRSGREVQPASTEAIISFGKRDGYEISLTVEADRIAILHVGRLEQTEATTSITGTRYVARTQGSIDDGRIRADFGPIGAVNLSFRRKGAIQRGHNQRGCKGARPTSEKGSVHGAAHLRGEHGYFRASLTHGYAELRRSFRLRCNHGDAYEVGAKSLREYAAPGFTFIYSSGGGTIAVLYATARRPHGFVELRAAHYQGRGPGGELQLETLEGSRGRPVGRYAYLEGAPGTFLTSLPGERPATATLAPVAPFHGQADYLEQSSRSHAWTGSLDVSLPGLDLPLAGRGWYTSLCVISPLKLPQGCDFLKPKPLRPELPTARPAWWLK